MAYSDQGVSSKRMVSLALVALLHVFLGYAFVTGLALRVVKVVTGPLKTFDVEKPIDKEEPPPPPPDLEDIPPYVPPPEVTVETIAPPPPMIVQREVPRPQPVITPPAPPTPAPAGPSRGAIPQGNRSKFSTDDYPQASRRAEEEGMTVVQYTINIDGRVVDGSCKVIQSSGHSRLDETTCRILERRFRFKPALENGEPVRSTKSQNVRWKIPK